MSIGGSGAVYAYKNHTQISCEYSAINRWLRYRDISGIQKTIDVCTIKNRCLRTKTSNLGRQKSYEDKR